MTRTITSLLALLILAASPLAATAATMSQEEFETVHRQYLNVYVDGTREKDYQILSDRLKKHYLEEDMIDDYYQTWMNDALFLTSLGKAYEAVVCANDMLDDMKTRGYEDYHLVNQTLGTIFESRGNYHMASFYFEKALESIHPENTKSLAVARLRMASLLKFRKPKEAFHWNSLAKDISSTYPFYHQVYLAQNAIILFAMHDKEGFNRSYQTYLEYHREHRELDNYGMETLNGIKLFYDGRYDEALQKVCHHNGDLDSISKLDLRILMLEEREDFEQACLVAQQRIVLVDSLNSDMLFDNLNKLHTEVNLAKADQKEMKVHERMLMVMLLLMLVIIFLLVAWSYRRRKTRQQLQMKNEQLSTALKMAGESDQMKTDFVMNVSHEIRTPLNAIAGFNEILNTPGIQLPEEERRELVTRINDNVKAITDIVDEMLHMAEQNTMSTYARTDRINCNQVLSKQLYSYRSKVSNQVELIYTSNVINRFTIITNEPAFQKIVDGLIQNAVKFTKKGSIELNCSHRTGMVDISVKDTGTGIPEDMQESIFTQFVKADSFHQGIGLGLTLGKRMAQRLGGDLTLDTTYKDGARFVLSLPCDEEG